MGYLTWGEMYSPLYYVNTAMGLSETQQLIEQVKKSGTVLLVCEKNHSVDAISSALAFLRVLKKLDKEVDLVCDGFSAKKQLEFLPGISQIKKSIEGIQQTILTIDTKQNKITDFSYDVQDDKLHIFLTPQKGTLTEKNIKIGSQGYKYDLIITFDVDDLQSIGPSYDNHTEFFFDTPIVNIAHRPENEQFGQINRVDLTKTSVAEVLYELLHEDDKDAIDKDISTCLLTGIISKTKGFKTIQVTPKTLNIASDLMERGADRQLIIQKLYQTKSVDTLKLWGIALSRLTKETDNDIAWTHIAHEDFKSLNTNPDTLREIIEELIVNAPEAQIIVLFYTYPDGKNKALIYSGDSYDSLILSKSFNPFGNKVFAQFNLLEGDLEAESKRAIEIIRQTV